MRDAILPTGKKSDTKGLEGESSSNDQGRQLAHLPYDDCRVSHEIERKRGVIRPGKLGDKNSDRFFGAPPEESIGSDAGAKPESGWETGEPLAVPDWKRALDLTCVAVSFPLWFPLMLVVACWVKLVSSGPLFFRQERIGHGERPFVMWKFRSMEVDAETATHAAHMKKLMTADSPMIKLDSLGDHRLIPGGRFLRATGLDELPQIFDVIRGEMSLVGPRPSLPAEFGNYKPGQEKRHRVLPGLTGLWQINGKNKTPFSEMIAMDIHYVSHNSLRMDLEIMARTIPAIVRQVVELRNGARKGRGGENGAGKA